MALHEPVPVSIITGFLGAGKTTLLNRCLKDPALRDTAVVINEFGDVGIDHLLVERSDDGIIELSDGCLCCTVRGALIDTLGDLVERLHTGRLAALRRVVIETTGLADPAPILQAIMAHPVLAGAFRLDGVVTLVDAVHAMATLDGHSEAVKQVAVADRIVLTKTGDAEPDETARLKQRLTALNPAAPLIDASNDATGPAGLFDCGLYDPSTKTADVARWLRDEAVHAAGSQHHGHAADGHGVNRHDAAIRAFTLSAADPVDPPAMETFLDLLRSIGGDGLLRMKGIVALADDPHRPLVLHGVQGIFHPPVRLAGWPDPTDRRTRLVVITRNIGEAYVRDLFDALTDTPRIDRPDRKALADNPLAIPGIRMG